VTQSKFFDKINVQLS